MAGTTIPWEVPAISGKSWTALSADALTRSYMVAKRYEKSVLVMNGGTSDIQPAPGDDDTAAQALADMELYANNARAAGFDKIIALTVTPAGDYWDADWNIQRIALNEGIRVSSAWDAVVDVAADPRLTDPYDATYYYDQLHWTAAGNAVAAELTKPALDAALFELR